MKLTVLLAEDEPALRDIFEELLLSLGHHCIAAVDGTEALELVRLHIPHVVVTDYMMPGRTGVEVMHAVHADPRLKHVRVILMSSAPPPESDRNAAWRFLAKPIEFELLERTLKEAALAHGGG